MKTRKIIPFPSILLMLTLFTFFGCKKEEVQTGQLIINGNVELGTETSDNWWHSTDQENFNVIWTDQVSFSPVKSLEISNQVTDPIKSAFWGQSISSNLPYGKAITLKVKIKGNLKGSGLFLAIRGDDTNPASGDPEQFVTTQGITTISGTFDWTDYSLMLSSVDASTKILNVFLFYSPNTTGEAFFDDITLSY